MYSVLQYVFKGGLGILQMLMWSTGQLVPHFYQLVPYSICKQFTTMVRPRCIVCKKTVTARQHALQCETYDEWQHRLCDTGKHVFNKNSSLISYFIF